MSFEWIKTTSIEDCWTSGVSGALVCRLHKSLLLALTTTGARWRPTTAVADPAPQLLRHGWAKNIPNPIILLVRAFHPAPLLLCLSHIPRRSVPVSTFSVHRLATVAASARHSWKKGSGPEARKEGGCCRDGIVHRYQLQGLAFATHRWATLMAVLMLERNHKKFLIRH